MTDATVPAPDWARLSGDVWARHWQDTDRGLAGLSQPLLDAVLSSAPADRFTAFEVGCGPGTTTLDVAEACPQASIVASDISASLATIAKERTSDHENVRVIVGDAAELASSAAPIDLIFSRHGVMFFGDPISAFSSFRSASASGAALVFSCFRDWGLNCWASRVADAVAEATVPPPGREPSGFAFAEASYVRELLNAAGWRPRDPQAVDFTYVAAAGEDAVGQALEFMSEIGPAARLMTAMEDQQREHARDRMRTVIESHCTGGIVSFPAAAWIWTATAS